MAKAKGHKAGLNPQIVFLFLLAFRLINAISIRTFFQPDEYFQSLEPAWAIAFGENSGAWITWEWRHQLRPSIHPAIFALVYWCASKTSSLLQLSKSTEADLLIAAPKSLQAIFAAIGDFSTWQLASRIYGVKSIQTSITLFLTILNPWQWFCATRTLSNCLETSLTAAALVQWPWGLPISSNDGRRPVVRQLRSCLILAASACILRPTNALIWGTLACWAMLQSGWSQILILVREALTCGSLAVIVSVLADRVYYQQWTFPPLRFLYFNIAQSLAVFYGKNDWHYYLSQGLPLLMTTFLPFAIYGIVSCFRTQDLKQSPTTAAQIKQELASTILVTIVLLSLISHKEVRFIYPLLPVLHLFAAEGLVAIFDIQRSKSVEHALRDLKRSWKFLIGTGLFLNICIAFYTSFVHQRGVIDALDFVRSQHEHQISLFNDSRDPETSFGVLMPCHSTPWRSHLIHSGVKGWALTCEPPVDLTAEQKAEYLDEADIFYEDPLAFLDRELYDEREQSDETVSIKKPWPNNLIFFEQLESTLREFMASKKPGEYEQCWRGFNSHWHDDWRRQGDVVIWCRRSH